MSSVSSDGNEKNGEWLEGSRRTFFARVAKNSCTATGRPWSFSHSTYVEGTVRQAATVNGWEHAARLNGFNRAIARSASSGRMSAYKTWARIGGGEEVVVDDPPWRNVDALPQQGLADIELKARHIDDVPDVGKVRRLADHSGATSSHAHDPCHAPGTSRRVGSTFGRAASS
jgi:hypothetical protein